MPSSMMLRISSCMRSSMQVVYVVTGSAVDRVQMKAPTMAITMAMIATRMPIAPMDHLRFGTGGGGGAVGAARVGIAACVAAGVVAAANASERASQMDASVNSMSPSGTFAPSASGSASIV